MEPADGCAAEGRKLAEEGDEGDERDGEDGEEDVAEGAHPGTPRMAEMLSRRWDAKEEVRSHLETLKATAMRHVIGSRFQRGVATPNASPH